MHCTADFCMHHYAGFSQIESHLCTSFSYVRTNVVVLPMYAAARYLCEILLENVPVDDIITIFSSHDLLKGNDLTVVNNAPSDYLKKVYLMRLFENIGLSVWSTICAVVNGSEILNHLGDQLIQGKRVKL